MADFSDRILVRPEASFDRSLAGEVWVGSLGHKVELIEGSSLVGRFLFLLRGRRGDRLILLSVPPLTEQEHHLINAISRGRRAHAQSKAASEIFFSAQVRYRAHAKLSVVLYRLRPSCWARSWSVRIRHRSTASAGHGREDVGGHD
jgi:hypothetical protein